MRNHIEYFTSNKYLVTGDLLDKTGTNGEPLIKNVKILKELQHMNVKDIKFKAKRLDNGEWVEGDLIHKNNGVYVYNPQIVNKRGYSVQFIKVDPSTVCMFTGLKDCDGNKIYEHDIISIFEGREPCEVIFEKGCFIASNHVYGIHTTLAKGIDYYNWKLYVISNKFDKKK